MNNKKMPALLLALGLLQVAPASAALYRCGNAFQDRPCDNVVQQEVVRPARGAGTSRATSPEGLRPGSPASAAAGATPPASEASAAAPATAAQAVEAAPAAAPASAGTLAIRQGPPSPACPNLRDQHTAIEARLRAGGRPETIAMYQRQQREVERNLQEARCP